jgi:hypothetical protein
MFNNYSTQYNTLVTTRCRKYQGFYPNFTPSINSMSVTTSSAGVYTNVNINGSTFLPTINGVTYVLFGSYKINILFYSTSNISFVVPLGATAGVYNVNVVNVYNNNFSTDVPQVSTGTPNYSNTFTYTIT